MSNKKPVEFKARVFAEGTLANMQGWEPKPGTQVFEKAEIMKVLILAWMTGYKAGQSSRPRSHSGVPKIS